MCFEASEYIVEEGYCSNCRWTECWPVLKCLTEHAKVRIRQNDLNRTCDEAAFSAGSELTGYRECWKHAPKHSSHWNVLSSVVSCICREGMIELTQEEHCCESYLYGKGVCDLKCTSEADCHSQTGQTCINRCQHLCAAFDVAPSEECKAECLATGAPCRQYTSCTPPPVSSHICDDGRWPEASSGCCRTKDNATGAVMLGCPKLCEAQHIWRLDGGRAIPWWSRWVPGPGIVFQCSCEGCPQSTQEGMVKLQKTLQETIWDNGQMMLIDIARRAGLRHGPNRKMQELMVLRNSAVLKAVQSDRGSLANLDGSTAAINDQYISQITQAARVYGDEAPEVVAARKADKSNRFLTAIAGICTTAIVVTICCATSRIMKNKAAMPAIGFEQTSQVVIGNPVANEQSTPTTATGTPVTVSAATKNAGKSKAMEQVAKD